MESEQTLKRVLNSRFNGKSKRAALLAIEDERSLHVNRSIRLYVQRERVGELVVRNALVIHGHASLGIHLHTRLAVSGRLHRATERQLGGLFLKRQLHRRAEADIPVGLGKDGTLEDRAVVHGTEGEDGVLVAVGHGGINALHQFFRGSLHLATHQEGSLLRISRRASTNEVRQGGGEGLAAGIHHGIRRNRSVHVLHSAHGLLALPLQDVIPSAIHHTVS